MNDLRTALLRGRNRPRNAGAGSPTMQRGDGYEFVELREYVAGDDPRRIDWAATARTGELQSRVVLEDVALTLGAILDDSPSMRVGRRRPLLDAARDALEVWYGAALADDRCARITGNGPVAHLRQRGRAGALVCLNASTGDTPFELTAAFDMAIATLPRGTALLVLSDFFDVQPTDDGQIAQLGARFDCTALFARDPWAHELPLGGFVRVRDVESGATARVFVGARERRAYAAAVGERERTVRERLSRYNWRVGTLTETNGTQALFDAFALRHAEPARA